MSDLFAPAGMVAAATACRLAGDWRGACAAALVDVDVNLDRERREHGARAAEAIEADLRGFAPDLLRLYLPRNDFALRTGGSVVLSRDDRPFRRDTRFLRITLPPRPDAPQRLRLDVAGPDELDVHWYDHPAWCWHADAVEERRWAYGTSGTRRPWEPGGGDDRATEVETIAALVAANKVPEAWAAAGIAPIHRAVSPHHLTHWAGALPRLATEVRRLARRYGLDTMYVHPDFAVDSGGRVSMSGSTYRQTRRPDIMAGIPPLTPESLRVDARHPLVHQALYPNLTWTPPEPPTGTLDMFVRCGGDWHRLLIAAGRITTPHGDAEIARENVLAGLGGPISGCGTAVRAWRSGHGRLPKAMRLIRQEVFRRAFHGDTDWLLAMLDNGLDPTLTDRQGRSLAHYLAYVDHVRLLPRLVAAGVRLDARDHSGRTPAQRAEDLGAVGAMAALGCRPA